jgi:uncharacterized phage protein (TIGR01671 family)
MNKIKFRAWTKDWDVNSRMLYQDELELIYNEEGFHPVNDIGTELIIMQFTGLHDKNGKEIYEGDIVRLKYNGSFVGYVVFHNGGFKLNNKDGVPYVPIGEWCNVNGKTIEVLGNIYATPKLLNEGVN